MPPRVLIVGVGNVLRGDDGFGVEALRRVRSEIGEDADVHFYESGIAGVGVVQNLLDGYDALIIMDAVDQGLAPGTVVVLEPQPGPSRERVDLHQANPHGVLRMASALGVLPPRVFIVGCQAGQCDELGEGLSEPVRGAIPEAVRAVKRLLGITG